VHSASSRPGPEQWSREPAQCQPGTGATDKSGGQHATDHLRYDTPLTSDIEAIARPCSKWVRTSRASLEIGRDAAEAVVAARTAPGQIATLIVPADVAWSEGGSVASFPALPKPPLPETQAVERAAAMLRTGERTAILIAGNGLYGKGLLAAGRIASATGSRLLAPYPITRCSGARDRPGLIACNMCSNRELSIQRISAADSGGRTGSGGVFCVSGQEQCFTSPECTIHTLAKPGEDYVGALEALAAAYRYAAKIARWNKPSDRRCLAGKSRWRSRGSGRSDLAGTLHCGGRVDDVRPGLMAATSGAPPHDWLANTGGSIGIALPLAVGAAVACPDRRVLCLSADGSGMYTAQALWTMARESLNVTTVVFATAITPF